MGEVGGEVRRGLAETRVQLGATAEVLESEHAGWVCEEQGGGEGTRRMEVRGAAKSHAECRAHLG